MSKHVDVELLAEAFSAAAEGVMYPFHGSPESRRQEQELIQKELAAGRQAPQIMREYSSASCDHAQMMSGAFSAISSVFRKMATDDQTAS